MLSAFRAKLRSRAQTEDVILFIGKNGVTDATEAEAAAAFSHRDIIKARVLETAPEDIKTCAEKVAAAAGAEIVQIIGNTFILYKELKEPQKAKKNVKPKHGHPPVNVKVRRRYAPDSSSRMGNRNDNAETRKDNRPNVRVYSKNGADKPGKVYGKRPMDGRPRQSEYRGKSTEYRGKPGGNKSRNGR
ncbi:MAG: YhbY family RNA-binding protein [Ruminococcus sp.]|jgi:RNA-binding protein|nr:YhbY family RNA-binding protein [Ruminococcus sp.]